MSTTSFKFLILFGETRLLRLWFGLLTTFFSLFVLLGASDRWEYQLTFELLPPIVWAIMFVYSGSALVYGAITCRYNKILLFLEGILGSLAWTAFSITSMISQGSPGAITMVALINIYLLIRYPVWQER